MKTTRLGRFLKAARKEAGLSQLDLGLAMDYTTAQFISNWERGISSPPLPCLPKLEHLLGLKRKVLKALVVHEFSKAVDQHYRGGRD